MAGVQVIPACEASDGTTCNATEIKATVDQTFLQEFPGKLGFGVGVPGDLVCSVDGSTLTVREHFTTNDRRRDW